MTQTDQITAVERCDRDAARQLAERLGVPDITGPRNQEEIARHFARHRTRELGMEEANAAVHLAMFALEELANTQMNLSLERWSELSGNIIAALSTRALEATQSGTGEGLVSRLRDVWGALTPGAIDRADLDGMAFVIEEAITALSTQTEASVLHKALEQTLGIVDELFRKYGCELDAYDTKIVRSARDTHLSTPSRIEVSENPCPKCHDSGYIETFSGGIWTGENVHTSRDFCDCPCGDDARDQENGTGLHATPTEPAQADLLVKAMQNCIGMQSNGGNGGPSFVKVSFKAPGDQDAFYSLVSAILAKGEIKP